MPTCELVMPFICMVICKTDAEHAAGWTDRLHQHDPSRWPRAGPHRFQPLGQLSFGDCIRKGRESGENKAEILDIFINHIVPGRAATIRAATPQEPNATLLIKIPIEEAVAKVRSGPPMNRTAIMIAESGPA